MQHIRALGILTMALALTAGCSSTSKSQRASQAPAPPPAVTTAPPARAPSTPAGLNPIPGHPPVTVSGIVASLDPATGVLTFKDGRQVRLTDQSKILQPTDARSVRPGELVLVRDALPIGVRTASTGPGTGRRQRMATVSSVDQANQLVQLTDGTSIRVPPSTNMHMGTAGEIVLLTDLRSGDELVIIVSDDTPSMSGTPGAATTGAGTTGAMTGRDATGSPSALPRQGMATGGSTVPTEPAELMVFRNQAP
jgi:hypothetical protein